MYATQNFTVVLLNAEQGGGKSTLAQGLARELPADGSGVRVRLHKFATTIYEIHWAIRRILQRDGMDVYWDAVDQAWLPCDPEKPDGVMLQKLGTEVFRDSRGDDFWVRYAQRLVHKELQLIADGKLDTIHTVFIFDDCRFINELSGAFPDPVRVRLEASEACRKLRAEKWRDRPHRSEGALAKEKFDLVVDTEKHDKHYTLNTVLSYCRLRIAQRKERNGTA